MDTITNWPPWMMTCLLKNDGFDGVSPGTNHLFIRNQAGEGCSFYHPNLAFSFLTSVELGAWKWLQGLADLQGVLHFDQGSKENQLKLLFQKTMWLYGFTCSPGFARRDYELRQVTLCLHFNKAHHLHNVKLLIEAWSFPLTIYFAKKVLINSSQ